MAPKRHLSDSLIGSCRSWQDFHAAIGPLASNDRAAAFERLTQAYLATKPEYRLKLRHVVAHYDPDWRTFCRRLGLPRTDEGIDLVAETFEGDIWAIQCKEIYDPKHRLTVSSISTFLALTRGCKHVAHKLVVHTGAKFVRKSALVTDVVTIGLDKWLRTTAADWTAIHGYIKGRSTRPLPSIPRSHQTAAVSDFRKHFITNGQDRGRFISPCGTGKSLSAFWMATEMNARSVLYAVPSLALVRQVLETWTKEYVARGESARYLVVCSDESAGSVDHDEFVQHAADLGIETTTDPVVVRAFLRSTGERRRIVITTYQSSDVLAAASRKERCAFDLGILDEAHKTAGLKTGGFATLLFDRNVKLRKRVFMTATERVLRGKNDQIVSMDDDSDVYGPRFHQLTFRRAIAAGIICDYTVAVLLTNDRSLTEQHDKNVLVTVKEMNAVELQTLTNALALRKAMKKHGIRKAITFHNSIRAATTAASVFAAVMPRTWTGHVSSRKSVGEREELMLGFRSAMNRAILTNARCLTEGVDVPAVDAVMFADPKRSVIDIVQATGRALRTATGKKRGYVLIPLFVPNTVVTEADLAEYARRGGFGDVARILASLATQDERILAEVRLRQSGRRRPMGRPVEIDGEVPLGTKMTLAELAEKIEVALLDRAFCATGQRFLTDRNGTTRSMNAWAKMKGVTVGAIAGRMNKGWSDIQVLETPFDTYRRGGYEWKGETLSLTAWAVRLGSSATALHHRLRSGMSIDEAFSTPVKKQRKGIELDGATESLASLARAAGMSAAVLSYRLKRGIPLKRALATPLRDRKVFKYRGKRLSLADLCAEHGVNYATALYRVNQGMSIEKALSTPRYQKKNCVTLTLNGVTRSLGEWSSMIGIKGGTLYARRMRGWTDEQILTRR